MYPYQNFIAICDHFMFWLGVYTDSTETFKKKDETMIKKYSFY